MCVIIKIGTTEFELTSENEEEVKKALSVLDPTTKCVIFGDEFEIQDIFNF